MQQFAIHFHVIGCCWSRAKVSADLAVNRDAARGDQFIAMTARTDASGGEETIEAQGKVTRVTKVTSLQVVRLCTL